MDSIKISQDKTSTMIFIFNSKVFLENPQETAQVAEKIAVVPGSSKSRDLKAQAKACLTS